MSRMTKEEFIRRWTSLKLSTNNDKLSILREFLEPELDKQYMTLGGKVVKLKDMFDNPEWHGYLIHIGNLIAGVE